MGTWRGPFKALARADAWPGMNPGSRNRLQDGITESTVRAETGSGGWKFAFIAGAAMLAGLPPQANRGAAVQAAQLQP